MKQSGPVLSARLTLTRKASGYDSNLQVFNSVIGKLGDRGANLLEPSVLSCNSFYATAWKRDIPDFTELARKRWVEKLSMDRIAADMGWGRTTIIRHLGKIKANPILVEDGQVRLLIHQRKYRFMDS